MNSGTTIVVVQARMTSSRLPGKPMALLAGQPMLVRVMNRLKRIEGIDRFVVAVPVGKESNPIADCANSISDCLVVRGSNEDVLERTADAVRATDATVVMRVTSDCPMIDPAISAAVLAAYHVPGVAYARLAFSRGFPIGFDTEVFSARDLLIAEKFATDSYEREHVTPFIWRRPERFPAIYLDHHPDLRNLRLVVDTPADLKFAKVVYENLIRNKPEFDFNDLLELFEQKPDLLEINKHVQQTPVLDIPKGL